MTRQPCSTRITDLKAFREGLEACRRYYEDHPREDHPFPENPYPRPSGYPSSAWGESRHANWNLGWNTYSCPGPPHDEVPDQEAGGGSEPWTPGDS